MLKYKNILVITVAVLVSLTVSIPSDAHNVASLGIDDLFLNVRKDQPASLVFRFTPRPTTCRRNRNSYSNPSSNRATFST